MYGLDSAGKGGRVVTADVGQVAWRVHLANRKSGWYPILERDGPRFRKHEDPGRRNAVVTARPAKDW